MPEGCWERPESAAHPTVWRRVVGRKPLDGKVPRFVIQDVPRDREQDLLDFMARHYIGNEPLVRSVSMAEDRVSVDEMRQTWGMMLPQRVSVVAFLEDDGPRPRIAGANMLGVVSKGDRILAHQYKGEALKKIVLVKKSLYSAAPDPFEKYGVQQYLSALGLSVAKEFQGQGLGSELLRARLDLGRAVGLKLSVTSFSSVEAQVLAAREGWEELSRVDFADVKVDGKAVFPRIASWDTILMAKRLH